MNAIVSLADSARYARTIQASKAVHWDIDKDGYASLPQGPGLGVEMNEQLIAAVEADPKRKYKWPVPKLGDGSVTDY